MHSILGFFKIYSFDVMICTQYLGQGGNFNNFLSQDHCEKFCSRSSFKPIACHAIVFLFPVLCRAGEPLKDSSGDRNMECSPTGSGSNSCPSTHSCESTTGSTTFGGVCCPRPQYVCKLPREQVNEWWKGRQYKSITLGQLRHLQ